ncbi:MAG: hypothetical protein LC799_31930 [Actinobacteria bacterium]|nr:hypothetical protein [Actinomycetota bacterium]
MSALVEACDAEIPRHRACATIGLPRATFYRHVKPKAVKPRATSRRSARRLSDPERQAVLKALHEPRFADEPPAQVFAKLLDEGQYLGSIRTMHRLLAERGQSGERRLQRPNAHYPVPRLAARAPHEVWTWDITKLATWVKGAFLSLYVVLDLYSRFVVAWMVAGRENSSRSTSSPRRSPAAACPMGARPRREEGKFILYLPEALRPCNPGSKLYLGFCATGPAARWPWRSSRVIPETP